MDKRGIVYRHIAEQLLKDRKRKFIEREIARALNISPDTVNRAVAALKGIGAAAVYRTYFEVYNINKLLLLWSVNRKFDRDIIYRTYFEVRGIDEIEDNMPNEIAYTSFSGYVKDFTNDVAAYDQVHVYAGEIALNEIKLRFPKNEPFKKVERYNLYILKPDQILEQRIAKHELAHSSVSLPQLYADLWNNNGLHAGEFLSMLEKRMTDIYAKAILE